MSFQLPKDFHSTSQPSNTRRNNEKNVDQKNTRINSFNSKLISPNFDSKKSNTTERNNNSKYTAKYFETYSPENPKDNSSIQKDKSVPLSEYKTYNPITQKEEKSNLENDKIVSNTHTTTTIKQQHSGQENTRRNTQQKVSQNAPSQQSSTNSKTFNPSQNLSNSSSYKPAISGSTSKLTQDEIEFKTHMETIKHLMQTKDVEQMVWNITKPKKADEKALESYFNKKVILISGASKGLGKHLALMLSKYKARLVLCARNMESLYETRKECLNNGADEVLVVACDVCVELQCKKVIDAAINRFRRIDVLLLNAGVSGNQMFVDMKDLSSFKQMFQQNTMGYINFVFYALPFMREQGQGHIVAISSMSGKIGVPYRTAYCTSKHAVQGFFETLRNELKADTKSDIKVTVCSPGWIQTDISESYLMNDKASQRNHYKLTPTECAEGVLNAIVTNTREERFQPLYRMMPFIHAVCPDYVDTVALKAVGLNATSKL